jgi:hypothetical protein
MCGNRQPVELLRETRSVHSVLLPVMSALLQSWGWREHGGIAAPSECEGVKTQVPQEGYVPKVS